jgi:hypothetical protein
MCKDKVKRISKATYLIEEEEDESLKQNLEVGIAWWWSEEGTKVERLREFEFDK